MADVNLMKLDKLIALRETPPAPLAIDEAELCNRYEQLFTGPVNDVLREFAITGQALPSGIMPLRDTMKACGIAFTIKSSKNPMITGEMDTRAAMLDAMPRNCMVIWETGGDTESAHWGEIMTAASRARGARGAVLDGGLRDTVQVLAQNFPVWNKYRTSNGSLSRCKIEKHSVPVLIGSVIVHPGDIVFGDIDGVIVVPRAIALDVLIRAEEIVRNEKSVRGWIERGDSAVDVLGRGGYF
jgi:regulator of RNase E activity RraA